MGILLKLVLRQNLVRMGRFALGLVLLDCALLLTGPDSAGSLVLAGFIVATVGLLAAAGILAGSISWPVRERRLARFASELRGLTRQCDPDAAGHVRPRAPGQFA